MLPGPQAQQAVPASAARAAGAFFEVSLEAVLRAALVARVGSDGPWCAQLACWPANDRCETAGCEKYAWYNFSSDWPARFCRVHKEQGMVLRLATVALAAAQTSVCTELGVGRQVFVRQKICQAQGCTTIASFGAAGQSPEFCQAHKQGGMVRADGSGHRSVALHLLTCAVPGLQEYLAHPTCEADGCALLPAFGFLGERPRRCEAHMMQGMVRMLAQGLTKTILQLLTCRLTSQVNVVSP